jgi:endonuclease YncB( thermonuclease family)
VIARAILAVAASLALPALAADLSGPAQVIDGDSIVVAGERIRLRGIDAPEQDQACIRSGRNWMAGRESAAFMVDLVAGKTVECDRIESDKYGRTVAICFVEDRDIGAAMVRAGWAIAYRRFDKRYVAAEETAKTAKSGIWSGECDEPEAWRRANPR